MHAPRSLPARLACGAATVALSVLAGTAPAMASTSAGDTLQASGVPGTGIVCQPAAGTVISSKPITMKVAWIPTSWSSSFLAGPGSITRTLSITSTTQQQLSASFQLDEGLFFASAKETYGVQLSHSTAKTYTTTYTLDVPAGKTAKMQQYHEGREAGIKQVREAFAESHKPECYHVTQKSATGNYFPLKSKAADTFCYAATVHRKATPQVRNTCTAVWK